MRTSSVSARYCASDPLPGYAFRARWSPRLLTVPGAAVALSAHPSIDALLAPCDFEIKLAVHRMIDEMQERILPGRAYDAQKRRNLIEIANRHLTPLAADPNLFAAALREIAGS